MIRGNIVKSDVVSPQSKIIESMVPSNNVLVAKPRVRGEHPSKADGIKLGIGIVLSNMVA